MKRFLAGLCLCALFMDVSAEQLPGDGTQAEIRDAKAAIKVLAGSLQTELKGAMQSGGPVAAIAVCNTQAMPITQQVSSDQGMQLGRVSLKYRNPANAPNAWQRVVLEDFEQQKKVGKDVTTLTWSETVNVDGEREFRFMKAIPTGGVCLSCHGTMISPEVSQALAGAYPQDRATGFNEGDIRGAFVVTRTLQN